MKIDATIECVGAICVDGGAFVVLDIAHLHRAAKQKTPEDIKTMVEGWYGYMAQWGDGDYPIYEVQNEAGDVIGLLILQEDCE